MHIKRVELEDIKSHAESTFEFERGTTAITGENGAGKTTLIEAIAWALFDLLGYKKEEFLRRGAKKGSVRVTFESGLDERDYVVYRDTGTGYYVYDPAIKIRIAEKKEEVARFLWQHLGVEPGTDLETLFKHAIGVPQGTFTAAFLSTAADRKKTFDTLLKVEEYRRGSDELLKTSRFIDRQIADADVKIARAEGEIVRIDAVKEEHEVLFAQTQELGGKNDELSAQVEDRAAVVKSLDETEARLAAIYTELERRRTEKSAADLAFSQREAQLKLSREAAEKLSAVKPDAEKHIESLGRLKELQRERDMREKMRIEDTGVRAAIAAVIVSQKHLTADMENIHKSRAAVEALRRLAPDQERLEEQAARMRTDLNRLEAIGGRIKSLDDQLERLRDSYRANTDQLKEAREKSSAASLLDTLEGRDAEIVNDLAKLHAALERDEKFQKAILNGLCPILSEKCLNLKNGQTLEMFVTSQFGELKSQITVLQGERSRVSTDLVASREAVKFSAQVSVLENRAAEISDEGTRLKAEREELEKQAAELSHVKEELQRVEVELKALDNPKSKIALLEMDARREIEVREKLSEAEKNLERLESDHRIIVEGLESYKDLDGHLIETNERRDSTADAYRIFLANEALAGLLPERESQFAESQNSIDEAAKLLAGVEASYNAAAKDYDRNKHLLERQSLIELQRLQAETKATLDAAKRREQELAAELERLEAIRKSIQDDLREKERLEKVAETTDFIRATLKEAAPLVARNYVHHVSIEANQMFREITGNAERTLKWGEDYGIFLEEGGYERPFVSLSGGEQMAAALSVRLALLKQLSDIRIAFFDEPTTNMDAERRENLAQQIGQIKHFEQLFVISHDDTFEGYLDHEIRVGVQQDIHDVQDVLSLS